jgi:predicted metal-dependent phosphoesterase TrpH
LKRLRRYAPAVRIRPAGADLHVHTTHSDGACSPGDVVRAAAAVGVSAVAVTDHDTVSAVAVARLEARRLGIELVSGIELTAEFEGLEIHILGHFLQEEDAPLVAATMALRRARANRLSAMVERLAHSNIRVDLDALARAFPRSTLGRRHLADWMVRTGQVADRREAFARYLGDSGPAQVPKPRLPWDEAISLIRRAGGVAGLAHPRHDMSERALRVLVSGGLGSIEVAGPGVAGGRGPRLRAWAERFGLVPIAGSDFHAPDRPGRWVGSTTTPDVELERLRQAVGNRVNAAPVTAGLESFDPFARPAQAR